LVVVDNRKAQQNPQGRVVERTGLPYLPVGLATAMIPSSNDFSATLRRREAELRYTRF
jgi:hypothetical protein